jgi:hypothetical protein
VSELFKAALAGAWTWVITYLFPASLAIGLAAVILSTLEPSSTAVETIEDWSAGYRTAAAIAAGVLLAMVLAGLNNGLHRVLEGYVLIPRSKRLWNWLVKRQAEHKKKLQGKVDRSTGSDPGSDLRKALLRERLEDYPLDPTEFGPTRYANSVRTMETYAVTRFMLDSQYLWGELTACTPESARTAEEDARSFVDFLVNLLFLSGALVVGSAIYAAVDRGGHLGLEPLDLRSRALLAERAPCGSRPRTCATCRCLEAFTACLHRARARDVENRRVGPPRPP